VEKAAGVAVARPGVLRSPRAGPLDASVGPVSDFRGGTNEALRLLKRIHRARPGYLWRQTQSAGGGRNQPALALSAFRTYQSAYRRAGRTESRRSHEDKKAFLNQLITWRELAVNLVRFDPNYDNFECASRGPTAHWPAMRRQSPGTVQRKADGTRRDPRFALECRPDADGQYRLDAQLCADVLGEKDPALESITAEAYQIAVRLNDK